MASDVGKIGARLRAHMRRTAIGRRLLSGRLGRSYSRRRGARAALDAEVVTLRAEVERHTERIDRLEELVRELVLATESLRRGVPTGGSRD